MVRKRATVDFCSQLPEDCWMVLHVHDEFQTECPESEATKVSELGKASITNAGVRLGLRLPLGADAKIGKTWKLTH
jgi:DNA polymerase I-like protein with 3'-5' exonuclease and polymerase domains